MSDQLGDALRDGGHRLTQPRRRVWEVLSSAGTHLTADDVADRVGDADRSSVYRSLSLFAELGLVRESNLGGGLASHWEVAHPDDHFHVKCISCGAVQHHADDVVARVRAHLTEEHDFRADNIELVASGLCSSCLSAD